MSKNSGSFLEKYLLYQSAVLIMSGSGFLTHSFRFATTINSAENSMLVGGILIAVGTGEAIFVLMSKIADVPDRRK